MSTQHVVVEVQVGSKRSSRAVEIPGDDVLVAASLELRRLGEGKVAAAGRYGTCIGAYSPPNTSTVTDVDPFTGARGETVRGGTTPARCTFWYGSIRVVADTLYETDPPQMYYYCKKTSAPDPGLFEAAADPVEEGASHEVMRSEYERNPVVRELCIRARGDRCLVCGLSFEDAYGSAAAGIIHVHHLEPLGSVGHSHLVDPTKDLIPVCPNCHAVIHRRTPPFTPDEVKAMLRQEVPRS
ncbi:MAG: hypothetical protein WD749_08810 [Phycisphaerales bacterium]